MSFNCKGGGVGGKDNLKDRQGRRKQKKHVWKRDSHGQPEGYEGRKGGHRMKFYKAEGKVGLKEKSA